MVKKNGPYQCKENGQKKWSLSVLKSYLASLTPKSQKMYSVEFSANSVAWFLGLSRTSVYQFSSEH